MLGGRPFAVIGKGGLLPRPLFTLVDDKQQKQRQRRAEISENTYENMNKEHFEFILSFFSWWRGGVSRRGLGHGL